MIRHEKAAILILSLWVLLFLTILLLGTGAGIRRQVILIKRSETARALQDAAISGALHITQDIILFFERKRQSSYDCLNEVWANSPESYEVLNIGSATCSYGYTYKDNATGNKSIWDGVIDEERKLNINYATENMIARLFTENAGLNDGEASFLARNIIDWRDTDNVFHGGYRAFSEKDYYNDKGYDYNPGNRPFLVLEELLLVDGMKADVFLKILDYITVFGTGAVNMNTAARPVLEALGMSSSLIDKIIIYRSGADQVEGTADDRIFLNKKSVQENIANLIGLTREEANQMNSLLSRGFIDTSSSCFRASCYVTMQGYYKPGAASIIVFDKSGNIKYHGYKRI
jgi:hypothetical protein